MRGKVGERYSTVHCRTVSNSGCFPSVQFLLELSASRNTPATVAVIFHDPEERTSTCSDPYLIIHVPTTIIVLVISDDPLDCGYHDQC